MVEICTERCGVVGMYYNNINDGNTPNYIHKMAINLNSTTAYELREIFICRETKNKTKISSHCMLFAV